MNGYSKTAILGRRVSPADAAGGAVAVLDVMMGDFRLALATIHTPSVIVRGAEDARSPRSASLEICEFLPHARFVEIAGAGHDCAGPQLDAVLIAPAREAHAEASPTG